jgi:hypothetical protein
MTKLKLPCDTTIQIEDRKDSRTLTICLERGNVFLLGEKYVIVVTYDTAKFLRDYLNEKFPLKQESLSEQMEAELEPRHWTGSHDIGPVLRHGRE